MLRRRSRGRPTAWTRPNASKIRRRVETTGSLELWKRQASRALSLSLNREKERDESRWVLEAVPFGREDTRGRALRPTLFHQPSLFRNVQATARADLVGGSLQRHGQEPHRGRAQVKPPRDPWNSSGFGTRWKRGLVEFPTRGSHDVALFSSDSRRLSKVRIGHANVRVPREHARTPAPSLSLERERDSGSLFAFSEFSTAGFRRRVLRLCGTLSSFRERRDEGKEPPRESRRASKASTSSALVWCASLFLFLSRVTTSSWICLVFFFFCYFVFFFSRRLDRQLLALARFVSSDHVCARARHSVSRIRERRLPLLFVGFSSRTCPCAASVESSVESSVEC